MLRFLGDVSVTAVLLVVSGVLVRVAEFSRLPVLVTVFVVGYALKALVVHLWRQRQGVDSAPTP